MLRPIFLLVLAFLAAPVFAGSSSQFSQWVPSGWNLITQKTGDLNHDGVDDILLVIEDTKPANFKQNQESFGPSILNLNPRRLIILLQLPNGLREILSRDDLLPSQNDENMACLGDPLDVGGVSIERGNLEVKLQMWLSCGSSGVTDEKFTFRFYGSRFRLIGYDRSEFSRYTGEESVFSTNFLTGKKNVTTGLSVFEDKKPKATWKKLPVMRPFFLDEIFLQCDPEDPAQKDSWCK